MNIDINNIIIILISSIVFVCIVFTFYKRFGSTKEHLTNQSDEAIQNLASLYNKDKLTIGSLTVTGPFNLLPKGVIVAWTGEVAPEGWALCNGENGTPDLRGRFIYGHGGTGLGKTMNTKGGAETHTLRSSEMPRHSHSWSTYQHYRSFDGASGTDKPLKSSRGDSRSTTYSKSTSYSGSNGAHNNMPPFHVLAYIMKL